MAFAWSALWEWCAVSWFAHGPSSAPSERDLQTILGGNITLLTNLCEKTRAEAFDLMLQHAAELGGNAVVGARYDATEIMQGVTEVLAYGTAVVVEPVR